MYQHDPGAWLNMSQYAGGSTGTKKITLPELQWLAPVLSEWPHVIGIVLSDDTVDLASQEMEMMTWMRANTPTLIPIVNQAQDGAVWLVRAGGTMNRPELYGINRNNEPLLNQAQTLLRQFDQEKDLSDRYGLDFYPLFNIGDGYYLDLTNSWSINSFQPAAALAYGATGLVYYTWAEGIWNYSGCGSSPDICHWTPDSGPKQPAFEVATTMNAKTLAWGPDLLAYSALAAVYHTGWPTVSFSPGNFTQSPGGEIVAAMADNVMLGLRIPPTYGSPIGDTAALAIVVDKRLEFGTGAPPAARNVTITFGSSVSAVSLVDVDFAALAAARAAGLTPAAAATMARRTTVLRQRSVGEWNTAAMSVNITLRGGESSMLLLTATDPASFSADTRALHTLRYDASKTDLSAVRTQVRSNTRQSNASWGGWHAL